MGGDAEWSGLSLTAHGPNQGRGRGPSVSPVNLNIQSAFTWQCNTWKCSICKCHSFSAFFTCSSRHLRVSVIKSATVTTAASVCRTISQCVWARAKKAPDPDTLQPPCQPEELAWTQVCQVEDVSGNASHITGTHNLEEKSLRAAGVQVYRGLVRSPGAALSTHKVQIRFQPTNAYWAAASCHVLIEVLSGVSSPEPHTKMWRSAPIFQKSSRRWGSHVAAWGHTEGDGVDPWI